MKKIIFAVIIGLASILTINNLEAYIVYCEDCYEAIVRLDENCCLEITVSNSYFPDGCDRDLDFYIFKGGSGDVIRLEQVKQSVGPDNNYVYLVCDLPDDEDIIWKVAYEIPQSGSPPWVKYFANGVITKEEIIACKNKEQEETEDDLCYNKGCEGAKWDTLRSTIYLPLFPDCPIEYEHIIRSCSSETQIKGLKIYIPRSLECLSLVFYLFDNDWTKFPIEYTPIPPTLPIVLNEQRLEEILQMSFDAITKQYFLDGFLIDADKEKYYCDNPVLPPSGNLPTTYVRSSCISYCASYYYVPGIGMKWEFGENDCTDGYTCCGKSVWYCVDRANGNIIQNTEMKIGPYECNPDFVPTLDKTKCYNGDGLIWHYSSPCQPSPCTSE